MLLASAILLVDVFLAISRFAEEKNLRSVSIRLFQNHSQIIFSFPEIHLPQPARLGARNGPFRFEFHNSRLNKP
jgi:hypothetical protein